MFNIKKQIRQLYASSIVSMISLSGAWVAILASRGFSLAQIGFAETVFHIASLLFEIPSGVIADVFGRKRALLLSCFMRIIADLAMILSNNFALVCLSMVFTALNYNFASGSDEALAYDSLKLVGQEDTFDRYASNGVLIYRICEGLSTLAAGLSLKVGYRIAYGTSIPLAVIQIAIVLRLEEITFTEGKEIKKESLGKQILLCFKKSLSFLKADKKTLLLMFSNSFVGAMDILLLFFLQAKLPAAGIPTWALGIALLSVQAGGILGAKLALYIKGFCYKAIFTLSLLTILFGITLEHTGLYLVMTLGGFIAALADDLLQVRTNSLLQEAFPSEQRATLISVESFSYSLIMIVLSPLAGIFFEWW